VARWEEAKQDDRVVLPDAWEEVWIFILTTQVRVALLTLTMEDRRLIALAYFHGWAHSEIALEYSIPLGTVKARMRRSLLHLKRALAQIGVTELTFSSS
jgi:DNA-directed RNA polymerase specialized sigma24 family protein